MMDASDRTDTELLADWLAYRRESAFRALVARYAGLVHRAASRTCGNEDLAADVSQLVFILLAKKAGSLSSHTSLGGWLHVTTVMESRNQLRKHQHETLKRERLKTAMETNDHTGGTWLEIQPALDDSLAALSAKDREALLLRFYRSMTVSEVATTLGTTTAAAQKRIDRATERLREKFAKRGCLTAGTLAAALATGLAADASAAVPAVSLMAAKAIAAGSASGSFLTSLIATATMKTASIASLIAVGIWLASQFQSISKLERENQMLRKSLAVTHVASAPVNPVFSKETLLDHKPVDWEEVARKLDNGQGAGGYLQTNLRLQEGFHSMNREELIAGLDEIEATDFPEHYRNILQIILLEPLIEKDQEYVLNRYIDYINDEGSPIRSRLANALGRWTRTEPEKAVTWFDGKIADGLFDSRIPGEAPYTRIMFEGGVIRSLLLSDPTAAGDRLAALPADKRIDLIRGDTFGGIRFNNLKKDETPLYANLVRQQLPEKDSYAISLPVTDLGEGGTINYSEVEEYMTRIQATPEERKSCILGVAARSRFPRASGDLTETTDVDLDHLREWVRSQAPDLVDQATRSAIHGFYNFTMYPKIAELALHCHEVGGSDEVLIPVLEDYKEEKNKELARTIASKLSDSDLREKYLKILK